MREPAGRLNGAAAPAGYPASQRFTPSRSAAATHGFGGGSTGAGGGAVSRRKRSTAATTAAASSGEAEGATISSLGRRLGTGVDHASDPIGRPLRPALTVPSCRQKCETAEASCLGRFVTCGRWPAAAGRRHINCYAVGAPSTYTLSV